MIALPRTALLLTIIWTAPLYTEGSLLGAPADCRECAVLFYPQRVGANWWQQPTVVDTLAKLPATDGQSMGYLVPLWVGYGSLNVKCQDAAYNWSRPSNYVESKNP